MATKKQIAAHINELDGYKCRGCGRGVIDRMPHHIIYRSQISEKDGRDGDWNLITLCMICDDQVHNGKGVWKPHSYIRTDRLTGRQVMIGILKKLENAVGFRWGRAYQRLRRKAK